MAEQILKEHEDDMFLTDDEDEDSMTDKYMTFKIADEYFGIAIQNILEIVELQKITEVPDMPVFVKGVINLRGKIIPVIDLRIRFHIEEKEYNDRTCIIITEINGTAVGFIVDEVDEVADIPEKNISEPPDFKSADGKEKYIKGLGKVGEEVKIILNIEKLLYSGDLEKIQNAVK